MTAARSTAKETAPTMPLPFFMTFPKFWNHIPESFRLWVTAIF